MRRFGLALVRDDRFVFDDVAASALIDKLFRQASLTLVDCSRPTIVRAARVRAFAQFVRLYRRHARRLAADEDGGWIETPPGRRCHGFGVGRRAQPAARAARGAAAGRARRLSPIAKPPKRSTLPLAVVIDRLVRARTRLAAHMAAARDAAAAWPQSAHLQNRQMTGRADPAETLAYVDDCLDPRGAGDFEARLKADPESAPRGRAVGIAKPRHSRRFRRAARASALDLGGASNENAARRAGEAARSADGAARPFGQARKPRAAARPTAKPRPAGPGPTARRLAGASRSRRRSSVGLPSPSGRGPCRAACRGRRAGRAGARRPAGRIRAGDPAALAQRLGPRLAWRRRLRRACGWSAPASRPARKRPRRFTSTRIRAASASR